MERPIEPNNPTLIYNPQFSMDTVALNDFLEWHDFAIAVRDEADQEHARAERLQTDMNLLDEAIADLRAERDEAIKLAEGYSQCLDGVPPELTRLHAKLQALEAQLKQAKEALEKAGCIDPIIETGGSGSVYRKICGECKVCLALSDNAELKEKL